MTNTPTDTSSATDNRHADKMKLRKAAQDKKLAGKTIEKGLLMVHTGTGKGKTTAGMGLVLRALGQGKRVCVVQFVKGAWETGEAIALRQFGEQCAFSAHGEGFTWETQNRALDIARAEQAWTYALGVLADPQWDMVLLDELNIILRYDYLATEPTVAALVARRPELHVVVTGRNAPDALLEAADMVTVMQAEKHHFRAGVKAQRGIEF